MSSNWKKLEKSAQDRNDTAWYLGKICLILLGSGSVIQFTSQLIISQGIKDMGFLLCILMLICAACTASSSAVSYTMYWKNYVSATNQRIESTKADEPKLKFWNGWAISSSVICGLIVLGAVGFAIYKLKFSSPRSD